MLLKARWIVPVSSPPIENGVVVVEGDRITFVGAAKKIPPNPPLSKGGKGGFVNLGDATLLPGLVNAHCHLEFSSLRGGGCDGSFTKWIRKVASANKITRPPTDSINRLLQTGTTTIADHCNPETPPFDTPFRRIIFWEVLGAAKDRAEASLKRAIERANNEGGFVTPHSLYGVHREIFRTLAERVVRGKGTTGPVLSVHLMESSDEDEFLRRGTGPLADYVKERGGEVSPLKSPLSLIPPGALLVHGNYLTADEIGALRDLRASVIHGPGSHRFFGHRRFPLEDLKRAGVTIALGTDSLASNEDLSMLREMRLLKESYPDLDEATILEMATINGARALGMEKEIGSIGVGKKADLIAVKGDLLQANSVVFSMINGRVCLNP